MPDISMCQNQFCTLKENCYRFKATPNEFRQSYGVFTQNEDKTCDYFWEDDRPKEPVDYKVIGE